MTEEASLKHQVLHSLKWVALGKIFTQLIRWAITFWVIRLLSPEDYGVVAMADVFFGFLILFIGSLFAPSLIQAKNLSKKMLKQIFGMILIVYFSIFCIQLLMADSVGAYFQSETVANILKVNAWCFLIMAFGVIPNALLARNMEFKRVSIISAIANIIAALTTLILAYLDYGFWALIIGEVVSIGLQTCMTFAIKPTKFLPEFKTSEVKKFLKFGGLLTLHSILFYIFLHMDVAIAGRILTPTEIGLFTIGLQFALMPQKKLLPLLKQVAFPAFSRIQDQPERISAYIIKAQKISLLMTIPVFWGLASVADQIVPLILGQKWVEAIIPTSIILLAMPLRFSEELFNPALKSQKKVKHMLINVVIMMIIMLISIRIGSAYGAVGLASAWALGFPAAYILVARRNIRELKIPPKKLFSIFFAPLISGIAMLSSVFFSKELFSDVTVLNLICQISTGAVFFTTTMFFLNKNTLIEAITLIKRKPTESDL